MPLSNTLTWDENPPRRPALDDISGGTKQNRPGRPPNPVTMPCAEEDNQRAKQIAAGMGRMLPMARLYVTFPGGVPTVTAVRAMGTHVAPSDFAVVDNGPGDTTIHWAASILPPVWSAPAATLADDVAIDRISAVYMAVGGRQAVRVKTTLAAAGIDAAFVLALH